MSKQKSATVQCPQCGKEIAVSLYESLNGDLDPQAKQALLDGTLFNLVCTECGYQSRINYDLLYHDMTHRVMVYYVAEERVQDTRAALDSMALPGYRRRIVTDQNALREKAIIFENEMDDRVIELIKCFYLVQAMAQYPDANIQGAYFLAAEGNNILQFVGDEPISTQFDRGLYDAIQAKYAGILTEETDGEAIIDLAWAKQAMRS